LAQAQINDTLAVLFSCFPLIELQTRGLPSRESPEIYHVPAAAMRHEVIACGVHEGVLVALQGWHHWVQGWLRVGRSRDGREKWKVKSCGELFVQDFFGTPWSVIEIQNWWWYILKQPKGKQFLVFSISKFCKPVLTCYINKLYRIM